MARYQKVANAFDAMKKAERIQALQYVVEDEMDVKTAAEAIGNSKSSVRRHLKDLESAGVIEEVEGDFVYTRFGKKIKASMKLLMYEEQMDFLQQSEKEIEELREDVKRRKKERIRRKISNFLS